MKHVPKGPAPEALTAWLNLANSEWTPSWSNFQNPEKGDTHQALLREQGWVCVYCGCRLPENGANSHIDHFWPGAHLPDRGLDYSNFFVSCGPLPPQKGTDTARRHPVTCGAAKADWYDASNDIIPSNPDCEARFRYLGNGRVDAVLTADSMAKSVISKLNLNDKGLVYDRKQIVAGIEADYHTSDLSTEEIAQDIADWRRRNEKGRHKAFSQVAARYLEVEFLD